MLRKHVGSFAALVTVGAIALSACGGGSSAAPATQQADTASEVSLLSGSSKSTKADQTTGDLAPPDAAKGVRSKWIQLRATEAGGLDPAVVNGAGRTVYWFSDDAVGGGKSNCNGECEKQWPPLVIAKGGKVILSGVRKDKITFITRDNGDRQVAIGGRPAYLFAKPGDILGQGVGGKWFVMNPEGKRATEPAGATPPAETPAGAKPATSATLFTGKNFDDFSGDNSATGVPVAKTCSDLRGSFDSLTADGALEVWSELGCEGESAVVDGDVKDLAALGFPDGVKSLVAAS